MKKLILLAALTLAWPVWAQAPAQPAATSPLKAAKVAKKKRASLAKRQQDARHCLQLTTNDAIIRCAEEYL